MVKITFSPTKEIVIHEISEKRPDEFYTLMIQQAQAQGAVGITPSVHWAHGLAFTFGFFPETPDIVKDKLEGKIHYGTIVFASVPEYRAEALVRIQGTDTTFACKMRNRIRYSQILRNSCRAEPGFQESPEEKTQ